MCYTQDGSEFWRDPTPIEERFGSVGIRSALQFASKSIRSLSLNHLPPRSRLLKDYPSTFPNLVRIEWQVPYSYLYPTFPKKMSSFSNLQTQIAPFFTPQRFPSLRILNINYNWHPRHPERYSETYSLVSSILQQIPTILAFSIEGRERTSSRRDDSFPEISDEFCVTMPKNIQFIHLGGLPPTVMVNMEECENIIVLQVASGS